MVPYLKTLVSAAPSHPAIFEKEFFRIPYICYRERKYFNIKPAGAFCRGGIPKTFDVCNIISKCACGAPTGKSVGCVVGLYIHKALSRWRDSVDTDVGKIPLRYVRLLD